MIKKIFYWSLGIAMVMFLVSIPLTHFWSLRLYLWKEGSSFYDFFTCLKGNIYWNRDQLYSAGTIYPPLANLFYAVITRCMSVESLQRLQSLSDYNKIKSLQECSVAFILYANIQLLFYYIVCVNWKKGKPIEKNIFAIGMLFTVPFLYQFERANIIFLVMVFTMLFFAWKDSNNRILRELSYLSLAIAAGLKIYPAVFGIVLLRERRYKDALRLVIYGIGAFLIPFVFYGGPEALFLLLENLSRTSGEFSMTRIGCQLDYVTVLKNMFRFLGGNCIFAGRVFRGLVVILGICAVFCLKETWKSVLLLTCMVIGLPSISYVYTAVFILIPLVIYLDGENKKKSDLAYLLGMLLVIIPLPFCWKEGTGDIYYSYMHVSGPVWAEGSSIVAMTVLLIADGLRSFLSSKRRIPVMTVLLCFAVFFSVFVNRDSYGTSFAYTDYLSKTLSDRVAVKNKGTVQQSFIAEEQSLDYMILRMQPAKSGFMDISVKSERDSSECFYARVNMSELVKGYNRIDFSDCGINPAERYILRVSVSGTGDEETYFWVTIDTLDTGEEFFIVNGEPHAGALGLQLYERR